MDFKQIVADIPDPVIFEREDMFFLLNEVSKINPKVILEIGTNQGKSAKCFQDAFNPELFITMDILPKEKVSPPVIESSISTDHYLWGRDSSNIETVYEVNKILNGRLIDFLWIDGNHIEEAVRTDFVNFSPFVRSGGIVGFHDVDIDAIDIKVWQFWQELEKGHSYLKYKSSPKSSGIGLLYI